MEPENKLSTDISTVRKRVRERILGNWPDPTKEQITDPRFTAIWEVIRTWDINVPEAYRGYTSATGNHIAVILNALDAIGTDGGD